MSERCHQALHVEGGVNRQCLWPIAHEGPCVFPPAEGEAAKRAAVRDELLEVLVMIRRRIAHHLHNGEEQAARGLVWLHDELIARREKPP